MVLKITVGFNSTFRSVALIVSYRKLISDDTRCLSTDQGTLRTLGLKGLYILHNVTPTCQISSMSVFSGNLVEILASDTS